MKKDYCEFSPQDDPVVGRMAGLAANGVDQEAAVGSGPSPREIAEGMDQFREFLENNNLKLTPQRERILFAFMGQEGPFSAEDLLAASGGVEGSLSLSTLYRFLGLLQRAGLARRIQQGAGVSLYESVSGHCCQLICEKCGRRVSVSNPYLEGMREVAARQEGYVLSRCTALYYGICPVCAGHGQAEDANRSKLRHGKKQ